MTAARNSFWISRVRGLLGQGFGVEDIALIMKTPLETVRDEVTILRQSGELATLYERARPFWHRQSSKKFNHNQKQGAVSPKEVRAWNP